MEISRNVVFEKLPAGRQFSLPPEALILETSIVNGELLIAWVAPGPMPKLADEDEYLNTDVPPVVEAGKAVEGKVMFDIDVSILDTDVPPLVDFDPTGDVAKAVSAKALADFRHLTRTGSVQGGQDGWTSYNYGDTGEVHQPWPGAPIALPFGAKVIGSRPDPDDREAAFIQFKIVEAPPATFGPDDGHA